MFVVIQKLTVKADQVEELVNDLSSREVLKEQAGFIDLSVLRGDEENTVSVIGRWESKEDWQAWENTSSRAEESSPNDYELVDFKSEKYEVESIIKK